MPRIDVVVVAELGRISAFRRVLLVPELRQRAWELVKHHREFVLYRFPSWPDWQITDSADLREGTRFERISPPK